MMMVMMMLMMMAAHFINQVEQFSSCGRHNPRRRGEQTVSGRHDEDAHIISSVCSLIVHVLLYYKVPQSLVRIIRASTRRPCASSNKNL